MRICSHLGFKVWCTFLSRNWLTKAQSASREGHVSVVNVLLEAGANRNIKARTMDFAIISGRRDVTTTIQNTRIPAQSHDFYARSLIIGSTTGSHCIRLARVPSEIATTEISNHTETHFSLSARRYKKVTFAELPRTEENVNITLTRTPMEGRFRYVSAGLAITGREAVKMSGDSAINGDSPGSHAAYIPGNLSVVGDNINIRLTNGRTPLYSAAMEGHVEMVRTLLDNGAEHCIGDTYNGTSPLWIAAANGHQSAVTLLITRGADFKATSNDGSLPLHVAALNGHYEVVQILLDKFIPCVKNGNHHQPTHRSSDIYRFSVGHDTVADAAYVNFRNYSHRTPLHLAAVNGHIKIVRILLEHRADINVLEKDGRTAIRVAVYNGHCAVVDELIRHGADVNEVYYNGLSLLSVACQDGNIEMVRLLVRNKADIGSTIDVIAVTKQPVWHAILYGHRDIIKFLVESGVDVRSVLSHLGSSQLSFAFKQPPVARFLEFVIMSRHNYQCTSIITGHRPIRRPVNRFRILLSPAVDTSTVQEMISMGADIEEINIIGQRPLHVAAMYNKLDLVKLLIYYGADVNATDFSGNTSLFGAVCCSALEVTRLLIEGGANVSAQNIDGDTPLHLAVVGCCDAVLLLLEHGARADLPNAHGFMPFHQARQSVYRDSHVLRWLTKENKKNTDSLLASSSFSGVTVDNILQTLTPASRSKTNTFDIFRDVLGNTALHYLAMCEQPFVLNRLELNRKLHALLQLNGADINVQNKHGKTPLHLAENEHVIKAFVEFGNSQSLVIADNCGHNFLHCTALSNVTKNLFAVVSNRREKEMHRAMNAVDNWGRIPLHCAVMANNMKWIKQAQQVGTINHNHVNKLDTAHRSSLHYAAIVFNTDIYDLLKTMGGKTDVKDQFLMTPLDYRFIGAKADWAWRRWCNKHFEAIVDNVRSFYQAERCDENPQSDMLYRQVTLTECSQQQCRALVDAAAGFIGRGYYVWQLWQNIRHNYAIEKYVSVDDKADLRTIGDTWQAMKEVINEFINDVVVEVGRNDERFTGRVIPVGSAYEDTQIGRCDEFDFMIELVNFSDYCQVINDEETPCGYVSLQLNDTPGPDNRLSFREFACSKNSGILNTRLLKYRFQDLLDDVLARIDDLVVVRAIDSSKELKKPSKSGTAPIRRTFKIMKPVNGCFVFHNINIDIVPAIQLKHFLMPDGLTKETINTDRRCYCVFDQPQNKYPWVGWTEPLARISFAPNESEIIRTSRPVVKAAYMVCKRMIKYFTHQQHFSSNILKTAVLQCSAEEGRRQCSRADYFTRDGLLSWVQKFLHRLLTFAAQDYVPSYSMPEFQLPVWEFEEYLKFSHIRLHLHGLTMDDFFLPGFFNLHRGKLKDLQLHRIMSAYMCSHLMYWSVLPSDAQLQLYLPLQEFAECLPILASRRTLATVV